MSANEDLVALAIRNRDKKAFENFFQAHYAPLVGFARGFLCDHAQAEDIIQSIFSELWEKAETLEIRSSLKSYVYQSARNRCLNQLKQIQVRDKHNLLYVQGLIEATEVHEDSAADPDVMAELVEALNALPPKMRQIMELKYMRSAKIQDISRELEISENTVKTQLRRARAKVRDALISLLVFLLIG